MTLKIRQTTLALCLAAAFAQASAETWEGSGPIAGTPSMIINALAVSPDGQTVYAGSQSGRVLRYAYAPTVTSVAVPTGGSYKAGSTLDFTVNWSAAVAVTGTPRLSLTIGSTVVYAVYVDNPTPTSTRFRYTLQADQIDTDGIAVGSLGLNGGSILGNNTAAANLTLNSPGSTASVLIDGVAPTLAASNIVVNNQDDPHRIVLTFSESLASGSLGNPAGWSVTSNDGSIQYDIESVELNGNKVTLTLKPIDLENHATYFTHDDVDAHLKVTPPTTLTDLAGNPYAGGTVVEAEAEHMLDETPSTLEDVSLGDITATGATLHATASEKVVGMWLVLTAGTPFPVEGEELIPVALGSAILPAGTSATLTIDGLEPGTDYDVYLVAQDAAGNYSLPVGPLLLTTAMPSNGSCGTAHGTARSSAPASTLLCAQGTASSVAGSGPWTWSCAGSGGGTTASCAASVYSPPPTPPTPPTVSDGATTVPAGGTTTVTGPAQVTANPGSTIVLSGPSVVGATLSLPPTPADQPVSVNIGGQTVSISNPGTAAASFTVQSITAADGSVQTVLVVTPPASGNSGPINITSTAPAGQVLVAFALPGDSGRVLEVVSMGGAAGVTIDSTPGGTPGVTGGYNIGLTSGSVALPIMRRPARASTLRAAAQDTITLHAGERAFFDSEGYFEELRLGTPAGDGAGDPLQFDPSGGPSIATAVPRLDAMVERLGKTLQQAVADAAGARLVGSQSNGVLTLDLEGERLHLLPLGAVAIQAGRADGVSFDADGNALATQGGVTVRLAPGVADLTQLMADVAAVLPGAAVRVDERGLIVVTTSAGPAYVVRPDWIAPLADAQPAGFANDAAGRLTYVQQARRFTLHAAFADLGQLLAMVQDALPGAAATVNGDGTVTVTAGGNRWTLMPAYTTEAAPAGKPAWWSDEAGRLWLKNGDGTMQEFRIE